MASWNFSVKDRGHPPSRVVPELKRKDKLRVFVLVSDNSKTNPPVSSKKLLCFYLGFNYGPYLSVGQVGKVKN